MRISQLLQAFTSACPVLPALPGRPSCAQSPYGQQHQEAAGGPKGELTAWLQVTAIPDMGIVSSSLDGTILVAEAASGRILSRICVHSQGAPSPCAASLLGVPIRYRFPSFACLWWPCQGLWPVLEAGVSCFAWSPALSLGISGGLQREILLWQPTSAIATGTLRGHSASVSHLVLDERSNQAPSLNALLS